MKFKLTIYTFIVFGFLTCNSSNKSHYVIKTPKNKNVPYLIIKSAKEIIDSPKRKASLSIVLKDSTIFNSDIGIELRGAVSQMFYDKKSYGFELRDAKNESLAAPLLGLPKNSAWILHGPYGDKTLLRNTVAYKISNDIGRYAARTKFVELEINGEYLGFYVLMEKLKQDNDRIKITKLSKNDTIAEKITGGYILKIDKTAGNSNDQTNYSSENAFPSRYDTKGRLSKRNIIHFLYEYPKPKNISPIQQRYIQNYMAEFENALASENFKDEVKGYQNYIDVDSFIDFFILTELMQNHDGYRLSTYLQKDRGKKLQMGPIWDFDIAFGSDNGFCDGMNRHAWVFQYNQYCGGDTWLVPFWWKRLMADETFKNKLIARWKSLRVTQLSDNQLDKTIDDFSKQITESGMVARNFERWDILDERITPNSTKGSHEKEIVRMKSWLKTHALWIDENIGRL
ncbi:CotH kinase family protein [Emticicia sp. SJ17W-69]|uniref:CotH kinase family protein n=1 Tax=Emticicia sp. SJ17W-69 TaxID=3421657 RepID=UPI003EC07B6C